MPKSKASNTRDDRKSEPFGQKLPSKNDELLKMLENNDTKIELISTGSLSGFIFKITNNVKSYIMKILLLSDVEKQLLGNCMNSIPSLIKDTKQKYTDKNTGELFTLFNQRSKVTEVKKDFVYESEIQNFIYNESKRGNRKPICPAVSYTKIFDNALSIQFLKKLRDKTADTDYIKKNGVVFKPRERKFVRINEMLNEKNGLFNCLQSYLSNPEYKVGIILMPEFENSITLSKIPHEELHTVDYHIYWQIIYLFLIVGVINFDMHEGNILISNKNGVITTKLIDFGKVDNLKNVENGVFLTANEKTYINEIRKTLNDELHKIAFDTTTNNETKHNFIMKTMNIINLLSWIINKRKLVSSTPKGHQMDWFEPIIHISDFMVAYHNVYEQNSETINATNLDGIIKLLISYDYNDDNQYNYVESFELLKNNYITESTGSNTYRNVPVDELTLSDYNMAKQLDEEIREKSVTNSVQPKKCEGNENDDAMCIVMGGVKKSTKKNITRKYIRKSIRKSISKSHKKIIRKLKKKI
uniref:Protein kinase domain-containing protein n=1 Tax=viral metagenome TaxID=1070528 RepID=A0A6C0DKD7_9ZZZZ